MANMETLSVDSDEATRSQTSGLEPEVEMTSLQPEMQQVFEVARQAAAMPVTVLLLGESGTGKNVLARYIHENSPRRGHPFMTVACPSLSRELLESELFGHAKGSFTGAIGETWGKIPAAEGGTLFLDEIGDLPLEIQPKLLRLLQERQFERVGESQVHGADVRIIAATHRNLKQAVEARRFREDLYYRINVIPIRLPSLRERRADLIDIARRYVCSSAAKCRKEITGLSPASEQALLNCDWPGNLRELRNLMERAVILADGPVIEIFDLPKEFGGLASASPFNSHARLGGDCTIEELEIEHIRQVLRRHKVFEESAGILGIDSATLYRKRKRYGILEPQGGVAVLQGSGKGPDRPSNGNGHGQASPALPP
jgi:NtrC-family two-component system response regulator AlgB